MVKSPRGGGGGRAGGGEGGYRLAHGLLQLPLLWAGNLTATGLFGQRFYHCFLVRCNFLMCTVFLSTVNLQ